MAYVGCQIIHSSKMHNSLKCSIDYITDKNNNFQKTTGGFASDLDEILDPEDEDTLYVYCSGCSMETAEEEWIFNIQQSDYYRTQYNDGRKEVLAYHLWQSFKPGEVTPEQAHAIGKEYAEKLFGDKYQYIICTHTDRDHIHNARPDRALTKTV